MVRALVFALVMLLGTTAAWADDIADCNQTKNSDLRISGCSKLIKSKQLNKKNRASAYTNRGNAYDDKGEFDRAIADYTKAIKLNPKDADFYTNRGNAYDDKGEFDRAIADFGKAIKLNPKDANAYNNRGFACEKKGDWKQAIADYRKALRLLPGNPVILKNLTDLGVTP